MEQRGTLIRYDQWSYEKMPLEDTEALREHHVKMETDTVGMYLPAKDPQGQEAWTRSQEGGMDQILPLGPQKDPILFTP